MKGIILAGGRARRLYPVTKGVCKQLLPIYDKPMIYYPLSVLLLAGIRDILVISTPGDTARFKDLLGDGKSLGVKLSYSVQSSPKGIAESLILGEKFIGKETVCLILGDNIFYGHELGSIMQYEAASLKEGAVVFGYYVTNPSRYGVLDFDYRYRDYCSRVKNIQEKPKKPKTNYAVCGIYFYDNKAPSIAKKLKPSKRGELEITGVNNAYLKSGKLKVKLLGRGYAWLDTGTHDALIDASIFIKTVEDRQGLKIGCIEEVAYRQGYISKKQLLSLAKKIKTAYGDYLRRICADER